MESIFNAYTIDQLLCTGVYSITCTANSKVYIGSATSTKAKSKTKRGFFCRFREHIRDLKMGRHRNRHLQYAFNKYGIESFIFRILEVCSIEEALLREVYWIDFYDSTNHEKGFNILRQALSNNKSMSTETKEKISKSLTGKPRPESVKIKLGRPVIKLTTEGIFLQEYPSAAAAAKANNLNRQNITNCCRKARGFRSCGGFKWVYKDSGRSW